MVQVFLYDNTQAVYLALAKNLTPYRAAAHVTGSLSGRGLAMLNDMVTGQAAVIAVIDQFEILMFAMLIVSPLVLFLRKPRSTNWFSRRPPDDIACIHREGSGLQDEHCRGLRARPAVRLHGRTRLHRAHGARLAAFPIAMP